MPATPRILNGYLQRRSCVTRFLPLAERVLKVASSHAVQVTFRNGDWTAANALTNALNGASSAPILIPNFGNVGVTGVLEESQPVPKATPTATSAAPRAGSSISPRC